MSLLKKFRELTLAAFGKPLSRYGFDIDSQRINENFYSVTFGNDARYVKVSATIHPLDYPPRFSVVLGEGGRDFLESDWNTTSVWRLKNLIQGEEERLDLSLKDPEKVPELVELARDELLEFGAGFLNGDVELFRQARSEQNRDRPPYRIHMPTEDGTYASVDDPESAAMKAKYS